MKKFLWRLLLAGVGLFFLAAGAGALWLATLDIPDFSAFEERIVAQSTKIFDRTGKILLYNVHDNIKRKIVTGNDISRHAKNATVAIEDSEFYEHRGVKPAAIVRAFFVNLGAGEVKQGGSTITQQLIKNSLLTQEKKISRKIKELILALKIERVMSKEEILSLYLNEAPYGGNIYGVEEAAESFFGKQAKDLSLAEAAYLAAIPKAPTFYSPYGNNREKLEERKNLVLRRMQELNFITPEEFAAATQEKVVFRPPEEKGIKAPHFVIWVRNYLEEKYGRDVIATRGLKIITTLDWELQKKAENIVKKFGEENRAKFNARNAGLVAIDPKTGQVLAMVGAIDYFDTTNDGNFNVVLAHRQPGSAFKPFVYATAFDKGYTPETVVFDLPTQFDTNCENSTSPACYTPVNYDGKFRGPISLRNALAQSINIPAIKTLYLAGTNDSLATAKRLGITSLETAERYGLTLVLGGGEVSLLELTSAYSVFANDGVRHPYERVLSVETATGEILEKYTPRGEPALPPNAARLISDILSDNEARAPTFGANSLLYFPKRDVAVKTGTTNDYRDAWIVGYSPNLTVGAWVGNNDNAPMEKKVAGFIVAPLWNAFMAEALKTLPEENFASPEPAPTDIKPVLRGFWQGGNNYFIDKISKKLATEHTPSEMKEEKVLRQIHNILYWVDKNNPLGPAPAKPERDPQFRLWEKPVRAWAALRGLGIDETEADKPKGYDDVHRLEYKPRLTIVSPAVEKIYQAGQTIKIKVEAVSRFPMARVDFFLNQTYLRSVNQSPYEISLTLGEPGGNASTTNELRATGYDQVGNSGEALTTFIINPSQTVN